MRDVTVSRTGCLAYVTWGDCIFDIEMRDDKVMVIPVDGFLHAAILDRIPELKELVAEAVAEMEARI